MLDGLRAQVDSLLDDEGEGGFVRLEAIEFRIPPAIGTGLEADIRLAVMGDDRIIEGSAPWMRWNIKVGGLLDYCIREASGEFQLVESDHVLARQLQSGRRSLGFRGKPDSPRAVVGKLRETHRKIAGDWIPFEKYFNAHIDVGLLLESGFGLLADGPDFLVEAYAETLRNEGVGCGLTPSRPSGSYGPNGWEERKGMSLATLFIGDAYFVAEEFQESPVEVSSA